MCVCVRVFSPKTESFENNEHRDPKDCIFALTEYKLPLSNLYLDPVLFVPVVMIISEKRY